MRFKIVVDSCCDLTRKEQNDPCYAWVPLTLQVDNYTCVDDPSFDQCDFLHRMKTSVGAASTACPSPLAYAEAYDCGAQDIYVVTLSAMLSGSHNSAAMGRQMFLEEHPNVNIHVFNSCSASAGEAQVARKLRSLAEAGLPFREIVRQTEQYIYEMQTMFVLENLENLRKNGRLTKVQSLITGTLRIKLLMGATPEGEICKLGQGISVKQALLKMAERIAADPNHVGKTLAISHCNCMERAYELSELLQKKCRLGQIIVSQTCGVSTIYANDGGIVVAY